MVMALPYMDPDFTGQQQLWSALQHGDMSGLLDAISLHEHLNLEIRNSAFRTPLLAILSDPTLGRDKGTVSSMAWFLIRTGADVRAIDQHGRSSLHYATLLGNVEAVEMLLAEGARDGIVDKAGRLAIHKAFYGKHFGIAGAIARNGVDLYQCDKRGKTPETLAREVGMRLDLSLLVRQLRENSPPVENVGKVGQLGKLEKLGKLGKLGKARKLGKLGKLGQRSVVKEDWSWLGVDTFDAL